ncbi:MAG: hypothetical protein KAR40_05775 [Candidatus Sabulitectum sp.]|nr:hypothetical protein [Candidatus Sabulitectum sp.]
MMRTTLFLLVLLVAFALAWDPLSYGYLSDVLPVTGTSSDFGFGYFGFSQYWETDTLGFDSLYDYREGFGVLRFQWAGRYGLTSSHTIGLIIPGFLQIIGPGDTTGVGIADPWICLDSWMSRDPHFLLRGALRPTLKGTLDTGDYTESDRHVAAEVSATFLVPISGTLSGPRLQLSGGLRHYFTAWDQIPGAPGDSAETSPGTEFRGEARLILPVNRELNFHAGLEMATSGETEVDSRDISGSEVSYVDLRTGIELNNNQLELDIDVYYRLGGQNVSKEWGIFVSGIGFDMGDLFSVGTGGRTSSTDTGSGDSASGRRAE